MYYSTIRGEKMKTQTHYTTQNENSANLCDVTKDIKINCVGAVDKNGFSTRSVRRDFYLMYVIKGNMSIEFGGEKSTISDGQLLIISPGTHYSYFAGKNSTINYLWIHFTGKNAEAMLRKFGLETNIIFDCGHSASIIEMWKRICNEFVLNDSHFDDMTKAIFTEILAAFSRRIDRKNSKRLFIKSVRYIHENYAQKISVVDLANIESLSESHYRSVFTKIFGESPVEYITARRIEAAAYMLENSDKNLEEIAALVGYSDSYYFGKQFKKKMGIAPGRYRKDKQG